MVDVEVMESAGDVRRAGREWAQAAGLVAR